MHILLVEDNEATARSVELILTSAGHNLTHTTSGEECVELVGIYDYDAVLMDIDLEDISGIEALRRLRMKKNATPVIILSGTTDVETKVSALAAGADDYMTKPFHKSERGARLTAVVRRSRGHIASVIRTASTVASTSCIRTMRAPAMMQAVIAASEPDSRRSFGRSIDSPMKSLFDTATSSGSPSDCSSPSLRVSSRECSVFLSRSWPGSMMMRSRRMPAATA